MSRGLGDVYKRQGLNPVAVAERMPASYAEVPVFREDRERAYPLMIRELLPPGLVGLALASLMADFMSTVSTHINWGASYLTNDFYYRFLDPGASPARLTLVSRLATVVIAVMAVVVASFVDNIGSMWELYGGMLAGLGLPHLMRWLWWRANAWTEIAGMVTGFSLALVNYILVQRGALPPGQMSIFPPSLASHPVHVICWISLCAGGASIAATLLTAPVDEALIRRFVEKVRPMGFWKGHNAGYSPVRSLRASLCYWALGTVSIYAGMFGIGYLLRLQYGLGCALLVVSVACLVPMITGMTRVDREGEAGRAADEAALLTGGGG